jgi:hypothetical protein
MHICRFVIHWHVLDSQIIEGMMFSLMPLRRAHQERQRER